MANKKINFEEADNQIITYLEMLLEKKEMGDLPPDILRDMLLDLYPRFEEFLFLSAMQNLSKDGYQKMDDFIEKEPSPEKSLAYLKKHVPDFETVIKTAMDEFEAIYLGEKPTELEVLTGE